MWTSFERALSVKCQATNSLDSGAGLLWGREEHIIVVYLLESLHIRIAQKQQSLKPMLQFKPKLKRFE